MHDEHLVSGRLSESGEGWRASRGRRGGGAFDHLLEGVPIEDLVAAPFEWREGWEYRLG